MTSPRRDSRGILLARRHAVFFAGLARWVALPLLDRAFDARHLPLITGLGGSFGRVLGWVRRLALHNLLRSGCAGFLFGLFGQRPSGRFEGDQITFRTTN